MHCHDMWPPELHKKRTEDRIASATRTVVVGDLNKREVVIRVCKLTVHECSDHLVRGHIERLENDSHVLQPLWVEQPAVLLPSSRRLAGIPRGGGGGAVLGEQVLHCRLIHAVNITTRLPTTPW